MPKHSKDFLLNSLKGRIWLAVSAMAVLNCFGGLIAYLAVSIFSSDPFYSVFVTFFLSALATVIFGWWLSNEVLGPIDKVSMLAQTLERSPAASLPRTTGATETDGLLKTLHRLSQQLNNLVAIMDNVAAGKAVDSIEPLAESDRVTASFQKLIARVAASIDAKDELIELQTAITRLSADASVVTSGNLNVNISAGSADVRDLADTFGFLIGRLSDLVRQINASAFQTRDHSARLKQGLRAFFEDERSRSVKLGRAAAALAETPIRLKQLENDAASTLSTACTVISRLAEDQRKVAERSESIAMLRQTVNDSLKQTQKLRVHLSSISQTGKTADEVSKRCKLIAVNASMQAEKRNNAGATEMLAEEIRALAARAESFGKDLAAINESVLREMSGLETSLKITSGGFTDLLETSPTLEADSLSACVERLLDLPARIAGLTLDSASVDPAVLAHSNHGEIMPFLTDTEQNIARMVGLTTALEEAVADLQVTGVDLSSKKHEIQYTETLEILSHFSQELKEN